MKNSQAASEPCSLARAEADPEGAEIASSRAAQLGDLSEELPSHLDEKIEELLAKGNVARRSGHNPALGRETQS